MREENDIPLYGATVFLIVISALIGFMANTETLVRAWYLVWPSVNEQKYFYFSVFGSLAFNLFLSLAILERIFAHKKQGSRLRSIQGEKKEGVVLQATIFSLIIFIPIYLSGLDGFIYSNLKPFLQVVDVAALKYTQHLIGLSFFINLIFQMMLTLNLLRLLKKYLKSKGKLPALKKEVNRLLLGSIGEEESFDAVEQPKWIELNPKALNGNI